MSKAYTTEVPASVMAASIETRLDYFLTRTISHSHAAYARERALESIQSKSGNEIIVLTGPTGVGKSTLAGRLKERVEKSYEREMRADPGFKPVMSISATMTGSNQFAWKDFYTRLLRQFDDIDPQLKLPFSASELCKIDEPIRIAKTELTVGGLERLTERALQQRKVKLLIIDEAHQILIGCKGAELRKQFEVIKSLQGQTNVAILLVGTYDMLCLKEQSAQLVRRSDFVHFARYAWSDEQEQEAFSSALLTFIQHMPFPVFPIHLLQEAEYFYLKSAGCVGILKQWLNRTVEAGLKASLSTITTELADRYAKDNGCIQTILKEAFEGERKLADIPLDDLRKMLIDHASDIQRIREGRKDEVPDDPEPKEADGKKDGGQKRRVGERNPKRDAVGLGALFS